MLVTVLPVTLVAIPSAHPMSRQLTCPQAAFRKMLVRRGHDGHIKVDHDRQEVSTLVRAPVLAVAAV
jgi:hypothetical protein